MVVATAGGTCEELQTGGGGGRGLRRSVNAPLVSPIDITLDVGANVGLMGFSGSRSCQILETLSAWEDIGTGA